VQDDEVGDGTTSVTVLTAELIREAEKLAEKKIHPQTIIEGYRVATNAALSVFGPRSLIYIKFLWKNHIWSKEGVSAHPSSMNIVDFVGW
jgi:hypothetical protein